MPRQNQTLLISCIIPAYNAAAYIGDTLKSLLRQTVLPLEIIAIDDNSDDNTGAIINDLAVKADVTVRLYTHPCNKGASAARNLGVLKARGNWLLFMDADDLAEPRLIECALKRIFELRDKWKRPVVLAYSSYRQIDHEGKGISGIHRSRQVLPDEVSGYLFVRNQVPNSGVFVAREAFLRAGGYNENLKYAEGWDLFLRLAPLGGFAYIDLPLVLIRRHQLNLSRNVNNMLESGKSILSRYSISQITQAVKRRRLPPEVNQADLVSILYRLDKWNEGFLISQEIVDAYPEYAEGYFLSGLFWLKCKDWPNAEKAFRQTLALEAEHEAATNNLAALLAMRGSVMEARRLLTGLLQYKPGYLDAGHNLALINQGGRLDAGVLKFTWRKLRPELMRYWDDQAMKGSGEHPGSILNLGKAGK